MSEIPLKITVGDLELATAGTAVVGRDSPLVIAFGPLKARFELGEFSEAPCRADPVPDLPTLTMIYRVTGSVPSAPFSFSATRPQSIGYTGGMEFWLLWRLSRTHPTEDSIQVHFTVYKRPRPPEQPAVKQEGGSSHA